MKIEIGNGGVGSTIILFIVVGIFLPEVVAIVVVVWFFIWIAGLFVDAQVTEAMKSDASAKLRLNVPLNQIPAEPFCPREGDEEKLELAIQEARRIANLTKCSHEGQKRIFEHVLRRECERAGVKVSAVSWRKSASA
jgi:hypothetical protein